MLTTLVHFEGIPGAGKTNAAQDLHARLSSSQLSTNWYLEEDKHHPITSPELKRTSGSAGFEDRCLDAWVEFQRTAKNIMILEGYALQSTVRLMYANGTSHNQITDYFKRWNDLTVHDSRFVYFLVDNPEDHYRRIITERGDNWIELLVRYVESTPLGRSSRFKGTEGFISFWQAYQELSITLLAHTTHQCIPAHAWGEDEAEKMVSGLV